MKKLALATILLGMTPLVQAEVHGKFVDEKKAAKPLAEILASQPSEALVMTEGTVKQVCEKKGCWMTLEDQGKSVRVTFKGYSFFVGRNLIGRKVKTEGLLQKKTQSVADQKHYLEDGGASKAEIQKVKAPLETFTFEATAVATL